MLRNLFDSLFIIDAKDKPAPSFLTAYIFTWFFWHNEIIFAFFKTKGDFTTRFNASINITTENQWFIVLCLTFLFVLTRFALNNSIYYVREFIDSKTQGRLNKKGHKSFISNEVYQKLSAKVSSLQRDLLSSQDREKSAKESEQSAIDEKHSLIKERNQLKISSEAEQLELKILCDKQSTDIEAGEVSKIDLQTKIAAQESLNESKEKNIQILERQLSIIKRRLDHWAIAAENNNIRVIGVENNNESYIITGMIDRMINTLVIDNKNRSIKETKELLSNLQKNNELLQLTVMDK
jgi:hypothetical protein